MATWILVDATGSVVSDTPYELATRARGFGDVNALAIGTPDDDVLDALGAHGVGSVLVVDVGDALPSAAVATTLAAAVSGTTDLVLFGMSPTERDVAGRLAARLGVPVIANAVDVAVSGGVSATSEILGGTKSVTTKATGDGPTVVLTRPKAFAAESVGGARPAIETAAVVDVGHAGSATITERHVEASEGPDLEAASVVVTGGRGLGAPEKFAMIDELAGLLGGAVGGTRAVVDAGWVPYSYQIGQTGKTVKPSVYIACGVSGAMQHVVGMKGASTIIAINKDPDAPIFGLADLGVVGDVHAVVPQLIDALKARA